MLPNFAPVQIIRVDSEGMDTDLLSRGKPLHLYSQQLSPESGEGHTAGEQESLFLG